MRCAFHQFCDSLGVYSGIRVAQMAYPLLRPCSEQAIAGQGSHLFKTSEDTLVEPIFIAEFCILSYA
jgi:hypothetical protein